MFDNAQGSLFGDGEDRMQPPPTDTRPDPARLRARLLKLIDKARNAKTNPWSEREVRMWRRIVPNMASWLPEEEGRQIVRDFTTELDRLCAER